MKEEANPSPLVSVGMPVYNGARFLEAAARAILDQSYGRLELIISDNASTDETPEICERLAEEDHRVRFSRSDENRGAAWNYNRVVELAQGEYFKWAAHDDLCEATFIERCLEAFQRDPLATLVYPRTAFIDEAGDEKRLDRTEVATSADRPSQRVPAVLSRVNMATPISGLIRLGSLRKTRQIASFVASDCVLLVELAILGHIVQVPETLFKRRIHEASSRRANTGKKEAQAWFDPRTKAWPLISVRQRLWIEYLRSAWRLCPGLVEKVWTSFSLTRAFAFKRLRVTLGRWRRRLTSKERSR